jgi:multidrug transporter EmrE-like cation transporter
MPPPPLRRRPSPLAAASAAHWAALVVAIAASQVGQVLLKLGATGLPDTEEGGGGALASLLAQLLRGPTLVGLGFYGAGTVFYVAALRRIPMSVALPCTAASYVAATGFGVTLFQEALSLQKVVGLLLVCVGVVVLAGSATATGDKGGGLRADPAPFDGVP